VFPRPDEGSENATATADRRLRHDDGNRQKCMRLGEEGAEIELAVHGVDEATAFLRLKRWTWCIRV
jgi:hypothetical protein